ncbi:hypothetical protein JQ557_15600 [Bradyrhizobium sp. U87765 SZCCT0131]|uniref:hypothetical protein n=1 Tax=unclassified Bradyrhizobium TaxID=2631580 RepID=UPI001BA7E2B9|nr:MULTISPECIES: hypothetical protein [unclassified Bradyrhizobium]MBR1219428.1 hypothetical protein [Bradyrhizobium sp. U87765 SZCCT0131]MBR1262079.1 hypothetical protein [Bradyrhizobium sp. U87765 SZCCT0134]MBR1306068.1 hypothetical protein [Bradyrhizobium sp. U87765 SZCCT0110]MBR1317861.1 hypothetical protein [Bradyrhizobium sp. U87765 SZCCT0109]MBR1351563.1 hypothetical protein [Bradyrhizobium sp. U87765 SZCCT0048]
MANYLVHVPVSRIVDVYNALKLLGTAELYDYKLVTVRCDMDLDVLQKVVDAVKPDQPAIIVKVEEFVFQGDPKVDKAVGVWRRPVSLIGTSGL